MLNRSCVPQSAPGRLDSWLQLTVRCPGSRCACNAAGGLIPQPADSLKGRLACVAEHSHGPKLLKSALLSATTGVTPAADGCVLAPTVTTSGMRAGVALHAFVLPLPAATTYVTPCLTDAWMAVSTSVAMVLKPRLRLATHFLDAVEEQCLVSQLMPAIRDELVPRPSQPHTRTLTCKQQGRSRTTKQQEITHLGRVRFEPTKATGQCLCHRFRVSGRLA